MLTHATCETPGLTGDTLSFGIQHQLLSLGTLLGSFESS